MSMCFVAGTLVHTGAGLLPIDQLKLGDLVLSGNERAQWATGYKRVIRTFVAHDQPVVTVSYQADKERDPYKAKYSRVTATYEHLFWIEQLGWSAARELNRLPVFGAMFRTADGGQTPTGAVHHVYRTDRPLIGWEATTGEQGPGTLRDYSRDAGKFMEASVYYDVERWAPGETDDDLYSPFRTTVFGVEVEDFHSYFVGELGVWVHDASGAPASKQGSEADASGA